MVYRFISDHLRLSPQTWMLPLAEQRRRRRRTRARRRRAEKLAAVQTPAVPAGGVRLRKPLSDSPNTFPPDPKRTQVTEGSNLPQRLRRRCRTAAAVNPQLHADKFVLIFSNKTRELERRWAVFFSSSSVSLFHPNPFRWSFPLGYFPLPGPLKIKPSHSTASLTMKKGGLSFFCCRRTHPSG